MLFFYGWRKKRIGVTPINHHSCTHCNERQGMYVEIFRSYIHLFWIPLIPLMKTAGSYCGHCKQVLRNREMPPDLRASTIAISKNTRTPWYLFALPALIALAIAGVFITSIITHS